MAGTGPNTGDAIEAEFTVIDQANAGGESASALVPYEPEVSAEERHRRIIDAFAGFIDGLQRKADDQVTKKSAIEERWLTDLRQFHGRYDEITETNLAKDKTKSRLFVNTTRTKTHGWEARLGDLLYPTDDRNWAITATPVPELTRQAQAATQGVIEKGQTATSLHQQGNKEAAVAAAREGSALAEQAATLEGIIKEAKERADLMEEEIADQFVQCRYDVRCRDAIRDMMRLGTAIIKGPVTAQQMGRKWEAAQVTGTGPQGTAPDYRLQMSPDPKMEYVRVDPWSYFPDMSTASGETPEFEFERHLWSKSEVRTAAKRLGFDLEATKALLTEDSRTSLPFYWTSLREITQNANNIGTEKRYQVWEYHGSIEDADLQTIVEATGQQKLQEYVTNNPMAELRVIIWFCQGHLLKIGPHPLDSGETLYSSCPFEHDDTSVFGFGVPYLMRDSQAALNAAWRMTMDNAGLSVGPQIVIDKSAISPADGLWEVRPRKIWYMNTTSITKMPEGYKPFQTFKIDSSQAELEAIVNMARGFSDEETSMPQIAYGEQATHITKTAQGMSMLMNSVNVVFRRVVKNWDDMITTPNLRRAYDWNMQFSKRAEIKGDYNVEARGSSVLLVREVQSQTLLQMLTQFSTNPVLGKLMKVPEAFRKFVQTVMIHVADIVKTDAEIAQEAAAEAAAAAKQGPQIDPTEQAKLASAEKIAAQDSETRIKVADLSRETALITLAQTHNMKLDELKAELGIEQMRVDHKERMLAAQLGVKDKHHNDQIAASDL